MLNSTPGAGLSSGGIQRANYSGTCTKRRG